MQSPTPYRALNASADGKSQGAECAAGYLYPTDCYPPTPEVGCAARVLPTPFGTVRPGKAFPHPGVLLDGRPNIRRWAAGTRPRRGRDLGLSVKFSLIPVVTFLAPLASNFEGLKDR